MKNSSIIGKKYLPSDNSYAVNITSASNYPYHNDQSQYLAGTMTGREAKVCTILTNPFIGEVRTCLDTIKRVELIIVSFDNQVFSVHYDESNILNIEA